MRINQPISTAKGRAMNANELYWGEDVVLGEQRIDGETFTQGGETFKSVTTSQILNTLVNMINKITPGENPGDPSVPHTV